MDKVTRQFRLQQWAEALRDHKESGLTVMEWCRRHNVSKYQYCYRQKEVKNILRSILPLSLSRQTIQSCLTIAGAAVPACQD